LLQFFSNGSLVSSFLEPFQQPTEQFTSLLGGEEEPGTGGIFQIDDTMIYDSVLTADDVKKIYTGTFWEPYACPPTAQPTVLSPYTGAVINTTVLQGVSYTGSGKPVGNDTTLAYSWTISTSGSCEVSVITEGSTSAHLEAQLFAIPSQDVYYAFYVGEVYSDHWEVCSFPALLGSTIQGNPPNVTLSISGIPSNNTNSIDLYLGETAVITASTTAFPPQTALSWETRVYGPIYVNGSVVNTTFWQTQSTASSFSITNTYTATNISKRSVGANTISSKTYQLVASNSVGFSTTTLTVYQYNTHRPTSPTPVPSSSSTTVGLAVGLSVGLSLLCLVLIVIIILALVLRFRGPKEIDIIPDRPDFDSLAFHSILSLDAPHVGRDEERNLKELETLLCDESFALAATVCDQMKATDSENVSKSLTMIFAGNDVVVEAIKFFITKEVAASNREGTLFRANSVPTKLFSCYCRIVALEYLWNVFAKPVTELNFMAQRSGAEENSKAESTVQTTLLGPVVFEVDPTKMDDASEQSVNTLQLWLIAQKLLTSFMKTVHQLPREVQEVLRHVYHEVKEKFNEEAANKGIGGFLFLRYVCPALMAPHVYGLLKDAPHPTAQRQLILIAKVLQNLANDTLPGKKEAYMEALNAFITSNQQPLKQYYRDLLDGHDGPSGARRVPEEVQLKTTLQMYAHIHPNQDKIVKALSVSHGDQAERLTVCLDKLGEALQGEHV